jgi:hypothetical protein
MNKTANEKVIALRADIGEANLAVAARTLEKLVDSAGVKFIEDKSPPADASKSDTATTGK